MTERKKKLTISFGVVQANWKKKVKDRKKEKKVTISFGVVQANRKEKVKDRKKEKSNHIFWCHPSESKRVGQKDERKRREVLVVINWVNRKTKWAPAIFLIRTAFS
jgi:hypothetical protein